MERRTVNLKGVDAESGETLFQWSDCDVEYLKESEITVGEGDQAKKYRRQKKKLVVVADASPVYVLSYGVVKEKKANILELMSVTLAVVIAVFFFLFLLIEEPLWLMGAVIGNFERVLIAIGIAGLLFAANFLEKPSHLVIFLTAFYPGLFFLLLLYNHIVFADALYSWHKPEGQNYDELATSVLESASGLKSFAAIWVPWLAIAATFLGREAMAKGLKAVGEKFKGAASTKSG